MKSSLIDSIINFFESFIFILKRFYFFYVDRSYDNYHFLSIRKFWKLFLFCLIINQYKIRTMRNKWFYRKLRKPIKKSIQTISLAMPFPFSKTFKRIWRCLKPCRCPIYFWKTLFYNKRRE